MKPQTATVEMPSSIPMAAIKALADEHNCELLLKDTGGLKLISKSANDAQGEKPHLMPPPQKHSIIPEFLRQQPNQ